jgi:hypothetical protein
VISTELEESTCPGCGQKVVVGKTPDGKRIQLHPLPRQDGYWYFGPRGHLIACAERKMPTGGLPLFVDHKQMCPQQSLFGEDK